MTDPFLLQKKIAVVTGAAGLLGQEHCRVLASAQAMVIGVDAAPGPNPGNQPLAPGGIISVSTDITNAEAMQQLSEWIEERWGKLDILINNAAMNDMVENPQNSLEESRFEQYSLDRWRRIIDVNVTGMFIACQTLGAIMSRQRSGSIINIASTYGIIAPDQSLYQDERGRQRFYKSPVYPTSKGAVLSFTRYLAAYWGHLGIRVNALSPGGVENSQDPFFQAKYASRTPLGRMANRQDFGGAILFLAGDASRYVTGANLVVDGGFTIW